MNEAQYLFTRSQHYFELSCKAEDTKEKKAFEAVSAELWLKATIALNRQVRLLDGLDMDSSERRTAPRRRTRGCERLGSLRSSAADQAGARCRKERQKPRALRATDRSSSIE